MIYILKKDISYLNDQNGNLRAQLGDMLESRLDKYNFDTKLTNKLIDSLVVQKGNLV